MASVIDQELVLLGQLVPQLVQSLEDVKAPSVQQDPRLEAIALLQEDRGLFGVGFGGLQGGPVLVGPVADHQGVVLALPKRGRELPRERRRRGRPLVRRELELEGAPLPPAVYGHHADRDRVRLHRDPRPEQALVVHGQLAVVHREQHEAGRRGDPSDEDPLRLVGRQGHLDDRYPAGGEQRWLDHLDGRAGHGDPLSPELVDALPLAGGVGLETGHALTEPGDLLALLLELALALAELGGEGSHLAVVASGARLGLGPVELPPEVLDPLPPGLGLRAPPLELPSRLVDLPAGRLELGAEPLGLPGGVGLQAGDALAKPDDLLALPLELALALAELGGQGPHLAVVAAGARLGLRPVELPPEVLDPLPPGLGLRAPLIELPSRLVGLPAGRLELSAELLGLLRPAADLRAEVAHLLAVLRHQTARVERDGVGQAGCLAIPVQSLDRIPLHA